MQASRSMPSPGAVPPTPPERAHAPRPRGACSHRDVRVVPLFAVPRQSPIRPRSWRRRLSRRPRRGAGGGRNGRGPRARCRRRCKTGAQRGHDSYATRLRPHNPVSRGRAFHRGVGAAPFVKHHQWRDRQTLPPHGRHHESSAPNRSAPAAFTYETTTTAGGNALPSASGTTVRNSRPGRPSKKGSIRLKQPRLRP